MRLLLEHIKTESFGPFNMAALVMVAAYVAHFLMYRYVYLKHMKFAFGRPG
jgi:hypothetical protein